MEGQCKYCHVEKVKLKEGMCSVCYLTIERARPTDEQEKELWNS